MLALTFSGLTRDQSSPGRFLLLESLTYPPRCSFIQRREEECYQPPLSQVQHRLRMESSTAGKTSAKSAIEVDAVERTKQAEGENEWGWGTAKDRRQGSGPAPSSRPPLLPLPCTDTLQTWLDGP